MPLAWEEDEGPSHGCDKLSYAVHHVSRHPKEIVNFPCVSNDCSSYFPNAKEMANHLTTVHQPDYTVAKQEEMLKLDAIAIEIKDSEKRIEDSGNKN